MRAVVAERSARITTFVVRVVAVLALGLVGQMWAAAPSHAAGGACAPGTGVTVVVQWQSSAQARCAPGSQGSALGALQVAGFKPARASQQAGYFLCRIDGNPASDPCGRAAPSNAYWSFWTASAGGSWAYSNAGVASYVPPKGSVIGFRFGAGDPPVIAPPVGSAPAPRPSPSSAKPVPAPSSTLPAPRPSSSRPVPRPSSSKPAVAAEGSTTSGPVGRSTSGSAARSSTGFSASKADTSPSSRRAAAVGSAAGSSTSTSIGSTGAAAPDTTSSDATPQGNGAATQAGAAPSSVNTGTSGSGGSLTGVAVGAGVLALLGAGAVIARKRLQ